MGNTCNSCATGEAEQEITVSTLTDYRHFCESLAFSFLCNCKKGFQANSAFVYLFRNARHKKEFSWLI